MFHNDQELFDGVDAEYFYVMKDEVWYVSKGAKWSALRDAMSVDNQM